MSVSITACYNHSGIVIDDCIILTLKDYRVSLKNEYFNTNHKFSGEHNTYLYIANFTTVGETTRVKKFKMRKY